MENINVYTDKAIKMAMEYGPQLILAIIVLLIGLSVIKSFVLLLKRTLERRSVDPTLTPFLINLLD